MASDAVDTEELAYRVQSLPPELYTQICDEVFRFPTKTTRRRIEIHPGYKPPALLAVNRAIRRRAAASFYDGNVFFVEMRDTLFD